MSETDYMVTIAPISKKEEAIRVLFSNPWACNAHPQAVILSPTYLPPMHLQCSPQAFLSPTCLLTQEPTVFSQGCLSSSNLPPNSFHVYHAPRKFVLSSHLLLRSTLSFPFFNDDLEREPADLSHFILLMGSQKQESFRTTLWRCWLVFSGPLLSTLDFSCFLQLSAINK